MSERPAIRLAGVSKMYKVFPTRRGRLLDALGLSRLFLRPSGQPRQFWSVRDVDLTLPRGARVGIIGRNGAGKSTLLKLITGAIAPSEGEIEVNGKVQALFEAGTGFHPEFTGYENIRASLTYQGLDASKIEAAVEDISEFTELGQFLGQPIKTYSMGMLARLAFATATAVLPDILIIDEVLGAGDAYFLSKSSERMRRLVENSGATVLLVSHAIEQILQYCEECIWVERGRIVRRGRALDVVNAYQSYIYDLEDRRLRAKNRRRVAKLGEEPEAVGQDVFRVTLEWRGEPGSKCSISELRLVKDGVTFLELRVGDVQDSVDDHQANVQISGSKWSDPSRTDGAFHRDLAATAAGGALGLALFRTIGAVEEGDYSVAAKYRTHGRGTLTLKAALNESSLVSHAEAPEWTDDWGEWVQPLGRLGEAPPAGAQVNEPQAAPAKELFRWASEGSLTINQIRITAGDGATKAVFRAGEALLLSFDVRANRDGDFNVVAGASLYRSDGIFVSNLISELVPLTLTAGQSRRFTVELSPIQLGDGEYVFGISIFEKEITAEARYDLVTRCIEFKVVGNEKVVAGTLFRHPSRWQHS